MFASALAPVCQGSVLPSEGGLQDHPTLQLAPCKPVGRCHRAARVLLFPLRLRAGRTGAVLFWCPLKAQGTLPLASQGRCSPVEAASFVKSQFVKVCFVHRVSVLSHSRGLCSVIALDTPNRPWTLPGQ